MVIYHAKRPKKLTISLVLPGTKLMESLFCLESPSFLSMMDPIDPEDFPLEETSSTKRKTDDLDDFLLPAPMVNVHVSEGSLLHSKF